jgi:mono/diheme cytochrome c family protein
MKPKSLSLSAFICVSLWPVLLWPPVALAQGRGGPVPRAKALELYTANCQPCHGPDGVAPEAMKQQSFAGRGTWKHGSRPQDVVKTITEGVPGTPMLPFKGRLEPNEIAALASLVRSFDKTLKPGAGGRGK